MISLLSFCCKKQVSLPFQIAINYVFSSNEDIGENWRSPYTKNSIDYVLSTTKINDDEWITVKSNVKNDFSKFA